MSFWEIFALLVSAPLWVPMAIVGLYFIFIVMCLIFAGFAAIVMALLGK